MKMLVNYSHTKGKMLCIYMQMTQVLSLVQASRWRASLCIYLPAQHPHVKSNWPLQPEAKLSTPGPA